MLIKVLAIATFLVIVASLVNALRLLVTNKNQDQAASEKIFKSLAVRIGLSLLLFIFIFIALALGWFQPEGIGARITQLRHAAQQAPATGNP